MSRIDFAAAGLAELHPTEMAATDGGAVPVIIVAGYTLKQALVITGGAAAVGAAVGAVAAWLS